MARFGANPEEHVSNAGGNVDQGMEPLPPYTPSADSSNPNPPAYEASSGDDGSENRVAAEVEPLDNNNPGHHDSGVENVNGDSQECHDEVVNEDGDAYNSNHEANISYDKDGEAHYYDEDEGEDEEYDCRLEYPNGHPCWAEIPDGCPWSCDADGKLHVDVTPTPDNPDPAALKAVPIDVSLPAFVAGEPVTLRRLSLTWCLVDGEVQPFRHLASTDWFSVGDRWLTVTFPPKDVAEQDAGAKYREGPEPEDGGRRGGQRGRGRCEGLMGRAEARA
ncbi:MAG: hypothetical protein LQ340_007230 [Diploschistes diacapsis]|nr:MAG: hypothetical protein LQ340_007230 [Diploschistes diacapsis]